MAFQLNVSNSLEALTVQLSEDLKQERGSVFQPVYLITQTEGMNNWLRLQLAEKLGIAANLRFQNPNELIMTIFNLLGGHFHPNLGKQGQSWLLFHLLGKESFIREFPEIAGYYLLDSPEKDLKRLALAEMITDLFDQYQVYRPAMIRMWNQGQAVGLESETWQMKLWQEAKALSEGTFTDKTALSDAIHRALLDPAKLALLKHKLPKINIVGMSVLTDYHLDLFHLVGKVVDLSFYMLNPAPSEYWFEDKNAKQVAFLKRKKIFESYEKSVGNPLLTNWGRVLQDSFNMLFSNEDLLNTYQEVGVEVPPENTLLQRLQADMFYNREASERKAFTEKELRDGSLTFHANYTPMREVESLYNFLVYLVDQKQVALSARDIVVMVSDIDAYAPYIKAVFQNAPHSFPYTIADETATASASIASSLLSILEMDEKGFAAESVLQLLDSNFIKQRFELYDITLIRRVVNEANFRFGIEGNFSDQSAFVSWRYTVQRIVYGICLHGGEEYTGKGESFYPLETLEGEEALEVIRFCHFVEVLIESIEARAGRKSLEEWVAYLEEVLTNLVLHPNATEDESYAELLSRFSQYNLASGSNPEKIPFSLFLHSLKGVLQASETSSSFASSGITFCSLIPMRSIPFKVVAALGLNFDAFPRKETRVNFNLMNQKKQMGDRNVKENDKHLFLETVLSAKQYLYLSYVGKSVKDNSNLPPSTLLDELLDYIQEGSPDADVRESLVYQHPLSSYSRRYRELDSPFVTYLDEERSEPLSLFQAREPQTFEFEQIHLKDFISFFKNPIAAYFHRVLKIRYWEEEVLLSETERFELDSLSMRNLKVSLLQVDQAEDRQKLGEKMVKTGQLPLRNMATLYIDQGEEEIGLLRKLLAEVIGERENRVFPIQLELPALNLQLSGLIRNAYGDRLVFISYAVRETKYLLEAYLYYLLARAEELPVEVFFLSQQRKEVYQATALPVEEAKEQLKQVVELYKQGHLEFLPLLMDLDIKLKEWEKVTEITYLKKLNDYFTNPRTYKDPYLLKKYEDGFLSSSNSFAFYKTATEILLLPLLKIFPAYYE